MTSYVAVVGSGSRAAGWATRFLASGLDVLVDDRTLHDQVAALWPMAQRLGLFPGASLDRLTVTTDPQRLAQARLVHVVGDAASPAGARLVATDRSATAYEPIHLLPLVELIDGPDLAELTSFYRDIGMQPCGPDTPAIDRRRLGPAIIELTGGDPDAVLAVMRSLRPSGLGAGAAIAAHEAKRFAAGANRRWQPGDVVEAPLQLYTTNVEPDWVDYNGHMTEAAYLTAAGWASDALFRYIGDDETYRAGGYSFYTVETHVHYLREVDVHEPLRFATHLLGTDAKRIHLVHHMHHGEGGSLLSTIEQMLVHVDLHTGRSAPIVAEVAAALAAIADAHRSLPIPTQVGSIIRLPNQPLLSAAQEKRCTSD